MEWWLGYLAIGAFVGFFAGLLGIGGGAVMVPLLAMLLEAQGMPREHLVHLAVGSAMATLLFTSVASMRAHARRGAVRWDIARAMTPGVLVGGLAGSALAGAVSTSALVLAFAVIIYAAGVNILIDRAPPPGRGLPGAAGLAAAGFVVSGISSLAALGGAFISVPFMMWCNVPVRHAIGTAAVIGFPIALAGVAGYVASGWHLTAPGEWTIGYLYLPAVLGISLASVLVAPVGAAASHRLPTRLLRRIFGVLLLVLATRMLLAFW